MKRLLVVDDEPHVARVLRVSLAKDGWSVDGPRRPEALRPSPTTPGRDDHRHPDARHGRRRTVPRASRRLPHRPFPILVMTSMTARDQRTGPGIWAIEFLEKPVSPRRIAALLAQLLSQEKHNA
jgi:DNA-binding response OmpR family regulator